MKDHHWLTDRQFLDAVAVAMITPGPVVITVGFIGFLVAGFVGAGVAPFFKKYGKRPDIAAFVEGVMAADIGTIAGAVVVLGRRAIVDVPTLLLAVVTLLLLWKVNKIPEPLVVLSAAVVGLVIYPLAQH